MKDLREREREKNHKGKRQTRVRREGGGDFVGLGKLSEGFKLSANERWQL